MQKELAIKHVVIIGAGFGGLNAVRRLGKAERGDLRITIIDRKNHHLFQPLLYQVATAGLSPADIAYPIRSFVRPWKNVSVMLAEVRNVDLASRTVHTTEGDVAYDMLVMACGTSHSYFGHDEWEDAAPGLKTLEQATEIRRRILMAYEAAELEPDAERRRELMTFVVVGGGPTGVEVAGALAEISRFTLARDFRNVDPSRTQILLVEGLGRILPAFDEELAAAATRSLESMGVTVWTDRMVTKIDESGVYVGDEHVPASTVVWAAGVQASPLGRSLGVELDKAGRVPVRPDLSIEGHPEVFVIGDQARFRGKDGDPLPGLAPVAIQQGRHVADNILATLDGEAREPFEYLDKGMMATIGRASAIAQSGRFKLTGLIAWLAWSLVHIFYLIGFRNRVMVLFQWMWSYVRFKRGARLITTRDWRLQAPPEQADDGDAGR